LGDKSRVFVKIEREKLPIYAWTGGLWLAATLCGVFLANRASLPSLWIIAGLAVLAAVAERQSVPVGRNTEASVAFLPLVFAAVAFGPFTALIVGALAALGDFRRPYLRWAVYLPIRTMTAAAAGIAASAVPHDRTAFGQILLASLAASVADLAADLFFNLGTQAVRRTGSPYILLRTLAPLIFVLTPLYTPLVALLVYGYQLYSVAIVGAFLVPAIALQRLIHLYQEQREAVSSLEKANARLERASLSFASALVATLDARDRYTAGHSAAVAVYSRDIGARMGLSDEDQAVIRLCGLVHDIGKIGLPAGLLEKPGALTLDERRQMEQHAAIGERILSKVDDYAEIARIVRHHHERVDGLGYPDGLHGDEIPLAARIIAVADAYNAMTSDRPYRDAMPSRVARLRLAQAVESQFDTAVVVAFEALLAGAPEAYRSGQRKDFSIEVREAEDALRAAVG
jgi:putative nucleotidyltransferase with HDIG domain